MAGVDPLVVGPATEVGGEHLIVAAGGVDAHIHFIAPQQITRRSTAARDSMLGGGTGPTGTNATTCTPGAWNLAHVAGAGGLPRQLRAARQGNAATPEPLAEQLAAGRAGSSCTRDWGTTPAPSTRAQRGRRVRRAGGDPHGYVERGRFVEDTIAAIAGRTIHTYHTEGRRRSRPDIIRIAGFPYILPSSTNLTLPATVNTIAEHLDMLMGLPSFGTRRCRKMWPLRAASAPRQLAAEDILHDMGVLSMISSTRRPWVAPAR